MPSDRLARWGLVLTAPQERSSRSVSRRPPMPDGALLQRTLERIRRILGVDRTLLVAARSEQRSLASVLAQLPPDSVILEPEDRGSGPAVLYGLLRLALMDLSGPVAIVFEATHVADDDSFTAQLDEAFDVIRTRPELVVLLGVPSNRRLHDAVWIEAGEAIPGGRGGALLRVTRIWDGPPAAMATVLEAEGALCSSPVIVGYPFALMTLIKRALPELVDDFTRVQPRLATAAEAESVRRLYSRLSSSDFCRWVLAARPANLAVLAPAGTGSGTAATAPTQAASA